MRGWGGGGEWGSEEQVFGFVWMCIGRMVGCGSFCGSCMMGWVLNRCDIRGLG
jgi:hypothetical protein